MNNKKDFSEGMHSLLQSSQKRNVELKKKLTVVDSDKISVKRTTMILDLDKYEIIKAISWYERCDIKATLNRAINDLVGKYSPKDVDEMLRLFRANQ